MATPLHSRDHARHEGVEPGPSHHEEHERWHAHNEDHERRHPHHEEHGHMHALRVLRTAAVIGFSRALATGAAMLSACLQRRHPHAAPLFATKFVFEAGMLAACDLGLLLGQALITTLT